MNLSVEIYGIQSEDAFEKDEKKKHKPRQENQMKKNMPKTAHKHVK